jgi:zinc/manganese transport system substrate-binding protein
MILKTDNRLRTVLALVLAVSGCGDSSGSGDGIPLVVATTSIWGDLVAEVVGDNAAVEVLIPRGTDPHDFRPSSRQVARMHDAALVVANGLGLEQGLEGTLEAAIDDGVTVLYLGDFITPRLLDDSGVPDPHFWTDPVVVAESLVGLTDALTRRVDLPPATWIDAADELRSRLRSLDATLSSITGSIAAERRRLVTTHDSLGYFADRYDFEIVGVIVSGTSTLASPSAADLGRLIEVAQEESVAAVFVDEGRFEALGEALAAAVGARLVPIVVGSLGEEGSDRDSYFGLMLGLGETMREALG